MVEEKTPVGHEAHDVDVRAVTWFAVGLAATIALIFLLVIGLFRLFGSHNPSPDAPSRIALHPQMLAPQPQLQSEPAADLQRFQAAENSKLRSYGWIDQTKGIARIPIERAMDLVAQRGLPTRGPGTQDASGVTAIDMQKQKAATTKP